ncbi:MAG: prepilin-type N-terminal cleavage/methylation domain-containing protein [Opitutaceae bacterium]|nr:prepilin-type N-terminal cleavage/methylation domain-containing protein [Opitutaceae bacterium]
MPTSSVPIEPPPHLSRHRGFTVLEVSLVVVMLAIISLLLLANIPAIKRSGEDSNMKAKAVQINTAMSNWMQDQSVRAALTAWAGQTNDTRYNLIKPYLQYPADTIGGFMIEGYTLTFPDDPRNPVTVTTPEGTTLVYQ